MKLYLILNLIFLLSPNFVRASCSETFKALNINYKMVKGPPGADTLVVIHGIGSGLSAFDGVIPELSKKFQILTYDQRGHGLTEALGENYYSRTMAADLNQLLDSLGLNKIFLIGHSMGARTAIRFAQMYPAKVIKLVIEDMHVKGRSKGLPDRRADSRDLKNILPHEFKTSDELRTLVDSYRTQNQVVNPWVGKVLNDPRLFDGLFLKPDGTLRFQLHPGDRAVYSNQALEEDLTEAFINAPAPILFLRADDSDSAQYDPVLFGSGVTHILENNRLRIEKGFVPAEVTMIAGASHSIHDFQKESFIEAVLHFFKSP